MLKIFVGGGVSIIFLFPLNGLPFLGAAIACTGGAGLIVIVPVFYAVGELVLECLNYNSETSNPVKPTKIISSNPVKRTKIISSEATSAAKQSAVNYIFKCRSLGWTDERIKQELRMAKWRDPEIEMLLSQSVC